MQWSEIVQLSQKTGIHRSTIKWRLEHGLSGPALLKPPRAGNYKITEDQAREIWADVQMLANNCRYREFNVCQVVADHYGISKHLVQNIRHGVSWNSITGLEIKKYY